MNANRCRSFTDSLIGFSLSLKKQAPSESDTTTAGLSECIEEEEEVGVTHAHSTPVSRPPGNFAAPVQEAKPRWADLSTEPEEPSARVDARRRTTPSNAFPCELPKQAARRATVPANTDTSRTTLMLRNLPKGYSCDQLIALFKREGFKAEFDFVYLPMDFQKQTGLGYAFVNLVNWKVAERARQHFQGFCNWGVESDQVCETLWSDAQQGLAANIERYRSSPVMHESVPDVYRPLIFSKGVQITFPPPTKKIQAPKMRRKTAAAEEAA